MERGHEDSVDTMMRHVLGRVLTVSTTAALIGFHSLAAAGEAPGLPPTIISAGDTAWVLASSALVLLMIVPGLALFYGGLVRTKNVLATIMHSFAILCLVTLLWIFVGYSLAFGPDHGGVIGGLEWIGLWGVGMSPNPTYAPTIPHQAFMIFQLMFAAITPALITGAFAERMRFSALLIFAGTWALLVYCPIAHWILREAPSFTLALAPRPWSVLPSLDHAVGMESTVSPRIIFRSPCWEPACSGLGGLALMAAARSEPMTLRSMLLSPRMQPRLRERFLGSSLNGAIEAFRQS